MPVHDWTRAEAGLFHHFHQRWISSIGDALNGGLLPPDYFALAERSEVTSRLPSGSVKISKARPNRVAIRHESGRVVAVIEVVSPGNKDSRHAIRSFVEKSAEMLRQGVHLLVVDLFPPTPRDPHGIHKAIWDELRDEPFDPPPGRPLTCAAYCSGWEVVGYVQPVAVGEALPAMPVFLDAEHYVSLDLEATYRATWAVFPAALEPALEAAGP